MAREEETTAGRLAAIEEELERLRRKGFGDMEILARQAKGLSKQIRGIVPVISSDADIPAEIYYAHFGANCLPEWVGAEQIGSVENWDSTDERLYATLNSTGAWVYGGRRFAWPTGPYGAAHTFEPKKANVSVFVMDFHAQFAGNADYTTSGIGLLNSTPGVSRLFSTATDHFIQVLRNAGSWELGTCDGSTISQSSGGTADANFHDFKVEWESGVVNLYVDGVLTITKTTNLPAQPLAFAATGHASAGNMFITAVTMTWR